VRSGHVLDGLGFVYEDGSQQYSQTQHGAGGNSVQTVMLPAGDKLARVSGKWLVYDSYYGSVVSVIKFTTQQGHVLGPFGAYNFAHNNVRQFDLSIEDWCALGVVGTKTNRGITVGFTSEADSISVCLDTCKQESGCTQDDDESNGCNQMYSCSHACKMRELGVDEQTCSEHCRRNGQSGCWPVVAGWQFRLCGACRRRGCRTHWPSIQECQVGCRAYDGSGEAAGCGGDLTDPTGVITSPDYPSQYSDNAHCEWTITVPADKVIRFEITPGTTFDIENHASCGYDSLEISFGAGSDRYCGSYFSVVQTHVNTATLVFSSDSSVTGGGFSISYSSVDAYSIPPSNPPPGPAPGSGCGGTLVGSSGVITSPNYPHQYPNNANCEWTVEVPDGMVILFEQTPGTEFNIEPCGSCQYDVLEIDHGDDTARDCGNGFSSVQTTSNVAHVTFVSDCSVTLAGFSITFTAVEPPTEPPSMPDCEDENSSCEWWRDAGYCQGFYEQLMSSICPAACNAC